MAFQQWLKHKTHVLQAMASLFMAKAGQRIQSSLKQLKEKAKQSAVSSSSRKARCPSKLSIHVFLFQQLACKLATVGRRLT